MLHIRIGPKAPLSAAREAIGISIVLERHASRLFSRGAKPSGVLTVPKGLSAEVPSAMPPSGRVAFRI